MLCELCYDNDEYLSQHRSIDEYADGKSCLGTFKEE